MTFGSGVAIDETTDFLLIPTQNNQLRHGECADHSIFETINRYSIPRGCSNTDLIKFGWDFPTFPTIIPTFKSCKKLKGMASPTMSKMKVMPKKKVVPGVSPSASPFFQPT